MLIKILLGDEFIVKIPINKRALALFIVILLSKLNTKGEIKEINFTQSLSNSSKHGFNFRL